MRSAGSFGEEGVLLHWNGAIWSLPDSPVNDLLLGLAGGETPGAGGVAVGSRKVVLRGVR